MPYFKTAIFSWLWLFLPHNNNNSTLTTNDAHIWNLDKTPSIVFIYFSLNITLGNSGNSCNCVITGGETLEKYKLCKRRLFRYCKWVVTLYENGPLTTLAPNNCQQSPMFFDTHDFIVKVKSLSWYVFIYC